MVLGFDRQGWITVFAALLLALITLFPSYTHVDLLGAASVDLPQQGIQRSTSTWSATRSSFIDKPS